MKTPWGLLDDGCRSRAGCDNLPITAPSVGAAEARGDSGSALSRHADGVAAIGELEEGLAGADAATADATDRDPATVKVVIQ